MSAAAYPVRDAGADDPRFTRSLLAELGAVLEMHGYPPVATVEDLAEFRDALFRFIFVERGALGELQGRLQGRLGGSASWTDKGALCSEDCGASAHELRALKDANGALVIACGRDGMIHMGASVDAGSRFEVVSDYLMAELERYLGPKTVTLKEHVYTVNDDGSVSS